MVHVPRFIYPFQFVKNWHSLIQLFVHDGRVVSYRLGTKGRWQELMHDGPAGARGVGQEHTGHLVADRVQWVVLHYLLGEGLGLAEGDLGNLWVVGLVESFAHYYSFEHRAIMFEQTLSEVGQRTHYTTLMLLTMLLPR
jgi:hypothetical protein